MSGDDLAASFSKELQCTKKEPYSEKDDMTTGILVVQSQRIYVSKELLSLYSPVIKELFANAEKGVVEELPVVKLENESATDIRTLLDMLYPDTNHVVNEGNLHTIVQLSTKFNIKRLRHDCIQYIKSKRQPKLIYRQLAEKFDLDELSKWLTDSKLATQIPITDIEKEVARCDLLDTSIPLRVSLVKLKALEKSVSSLWDVGDSVWYYKKGGRCAKCGTNGNLSKSSTAGYDYRGVRLVSEESFDDVARTWATYR